MLLVIKHLHNELNSSGNVICQLPLQLFKISLRAKALRPFINLITFCSCSSWLANVTTRSKGQKEIKRKLYKTLTKLPGPRPQCTEISSCWHTIYSKWPFSCVHKHLYSQVTSTPKGKVDKSKVYPCSNHKLGNSSYLESRELEQLAVNKLHFKVAITVWGRPWGIKTSSRTLWRARLSLSSERRSSWKLWMYWTVWWSLCKAKGCHPNGPNRPGTYISELLFQEQKI